MDRGALWAAVHGDANNWTQLSNWYSVQIYVVLVVQSPSHIQLFATPWTAPYQASLSLTISRSWPKFISIASGMPSSHFILWCPLILLPSNFPSISDFSNELAVYIRWPKYWSFSFSLSPFNECSRFISFKIDWFDLLAVQGTFRTLLQHNSWKPSILWCPAFFLVQLSQPYLTTGKTIVLTIQTFVNRIISLLSNTLSMFVTAFLPKSSLLLSSWLYSLSSLILEPNKRKFVIISTFSPFICREIMGPDAVILYLLILHFKPVFHSPPSPSSRGSLVSLYFMPLQWYYPHIWGCWCFSHLSWFHLVTHPVHHFSWCAQYTA